MRGRHCRHLLCALSVEPPVLLSLVEPLPLFVEPPLFIELPLLPLPIESSASAAVPERATARASVNKVDLIIKDSKLDV
jgi:hypothetical protein